MRASEPRTHEPPARLRLPPAAAALLFLYGYLAPYLPAPGTRGLVLALAINLTLFAALVAGLSPLRLIGIRALLIAALAAGLSVVFTYLGWVPPANVAKTVAAAGVGYWLAGAITSPAVIVLVAGLSAVVDIVSVATGPTKVLLERAPAAVGYLTVVFAWPGRAIADGYTALGVADLIFFSLYVGAARTLGLRSAATVVGVVGIAVAVVAGMRVRRHAGAALDGGGIPGRERRPALRAGRQGAGERRSAGLRRGRPPAGGLSRRASNRATVSMWCVCGNMSTGATRRSAYPSSASCAALPARVVGLHET